MNLRCARMLEVLGGEPAAILIAEVKPEDFDVDGNLSGES